MKVKKLILPTLYFLCVVAFVVFATGLASIFSQMQSRGFNLSEYWQLAVFGFVPSFAVSVYSAIMLVASLIKLVKEGKQSAEQDENPVNLTKTGGEEGKGEDQEIAEPLSAEVVEGPSEVLPALKHSPAEQKRRLTFKERRKQKLLEDDKPNKKTHGAFGVFMVCAALVFSCWFSVWSYAPNELCFHKYTYSETNAPAAEDEVVNQNYRFYQDILGRPYCIQEASGGTRQFRVKQKSKQHGSDENGKYVLYTFDTEEKYAKVLDCAMENFSYLTVKIEVKFYKKDAHIVVNHSAVARRMGKESVLNLTREKVYTYKKLNN